MPLPDIDFHQIRLHRGTRSDAFEELCCQLAGDEPYDDRTGFVRKGRGADAGLEAFMTHADGQETGWQVKYYWDMDSALTSLSDSFATALAKHPRMTRFIACLPFNPPDGRKDTDKGGNKTRQESALDKWNRWVRQRVDDATRLGRTMIIERWDAAAITSRLTASDPRAGGRIAFWFDEQLIEAAWLQRTFGRVIADLGDRYSPNTHIDLPIRRSISAILKDPALLAELAEQGPGLRDMLRDAVQGGLPQALIDGAHAVAETLATLVDPESDTLPVLPLGKLRAEVAAAQDRARDHYMALRDRRVDPEAAESHLAAAMVELLGETGRRLADTALDLFDHQALLITGEAGQGKSHLLADACAHQLQSGAPVLLILGGHLQPGEPWNEIMCGLDLPRHLQAQQFLGALNAAGEAAGMRSLIAIDAINERHGQDIWPERLAGLLRDLADFPWIGIVLSCRSTYEPLVIPDSLDGAQLPRIIHEGFTAAQAIHYLRQRGITLPDTPRSIDELRTPLFIRICCDALDLDGGALLTRGLGGVTAMFAMYHQAIERKINRDLRLVAQRRLVPEAIAAVAGVMAAAGSNSIAYGAADRAVRSLHDGDGVARDLLFQLEAGGLFTVDQIRTGPGTSETLLRFTFERMGDHAIACLLLSQGGAADGTAWGPGSALAGAFDDPDSKIIDGLVEALAVQLPEQFGVEGPDSGIDDDWTDWSDVFVQSLSDRDPDSFTDRTWELIDAIGGDPLRFDTMIAFATEPDCDHNVDRLDAELRAMAMPERDARWSIAIARDGDQADILIAWARDSMGAVLAPDRARRAAIQLCWFLTTSNRTRRDLATKGLTIMLADRPELAGELLRRFVDIDDLYLLERLAAALYGAAMQGRWSRDALAAVAGALHASLFAGGAPPANILLRDHALGLIRYAQHRDALPNGLDRNGIDPPYRSAWPIEHISERTMASFRAGVDEGEVEDDDHGYPDAIVMSCIDGDFARYVLDPIVDDWSPAPRGTQRLPTAENMRQAWFERFDRSATLEMRAAYVALEAMIRRENATGLIYGQTADAITAAKAAFAATMSEAAYEEWRAEAEFWRNDGMYQSHPRPDRPASFNLAWARRWVAWRAHDLGWSAARHGAFDRTVGGGRHDHDLERIGKKYQWLALYELIARMDDNLEPLRDRLHRVDGPLQLRNLDPSMLRTRTEDDGWIRFSRACFWVPSPQNLIDMPVADALAWLRGQQDIIDGPDNILVTDPEDGRAWLVLTGFESWRAGPEPIRRDIWRRLGCFAVRNTDRAAVLALLQGAQMTEHLSMPSAPGSDYRAHLGEYHWAWPDPEYPGGWIEDWRPRSARAARRKPIAIRPTTAEYMAEATGFDASIEKTINLHLPAGWLMEGLGLRLSDGRSIEFVDEDGVVRFMDPSVARSGRSAALVDFTAFKALLAREGLSAIWAVAGEKNVYGESTSNGFGGRYTFTRLYHLDDSGQIIAGTITEQFEKPNAAQLAALRKAERST